MSKYEIAAEDSAPIVIGGIGGSGTRLVTEILRQEGVFFGGDMNGELDNLWFSLLFVRRTIALKPIEEMERLVWLFINAMRKRLPVQDKQLVMLLDEAAEHDRGPALSKSVLELARDSICREDLSKSAHSLWGWKQPNAHILVPWLDRCIPQMKYIYVVRNGLDMAFGYNQNQLKYFWGNLLLEGELEPSPRNALRYWVACYKRNCNYGTLLGNRLYILNFDLLCRNPIDQMQRLNQFLGLDVGRDKVESVARSVTTPGSTGRHRQNDHSQLRLQDIEFVRSLGFDVESV